MNIVKVINWVLMSLFLTISFNVFAEKTPYVVVEAINLQIKLSKDGTGIIKDICATCKVHHVNITANSKATANGVEVDMQQARSRSGKLTMVSFNPVTREVQYIRWYDERK